MINKLQLLRNIGLFDSVSTGAIIPLACLTLGYAENGRGKTTLAAILRSLATGDPIPIAERRRLTAQYPPHVVVDCDGGPPAAIFQNNAWNRTLSNMVVFDDIFVDQNVYSGLAVESEHRQNLHELIIGARGVTLNRQLQGLIEKIEAHNTVLRTKAEAIPLAGYGTLSVDEFCTLPARDNIDEAIREAERKLAAAREQEAVRNTALFDVLSLPAFDLTAIGRALLEDLPSLDAAAVAQVQAHAAGLGSGGETWIEEGMRRVMASTTGTMTAKCPYCAQDLTGSPVMNHYRAYFSAEYGDLKRRLSQAIVDIQRTHGGDVPAAFERAVRVAVERRQFWSRFSDVLDLNLDTATIVRDWRMAREAVTEALSAKQSSPLERMMLQHEAQTRGGPACSYNVLINNTPVAVAGGTPSVGHPSFRNTLSAGDRNTLALAFFFASLDQDPGLVNKIVVIDDPISSLDEHRALTTVQELRRLADRVAQVIVLSHNKPFLCRIWEGADPTTRAAVEVARDGTGSTLRVWDVNQDCITEHDRRHALLRQYQVTHTSNNREVARAIRLVLEAFCRVAYPEEFPPGTLLGPFLNLCRQRIGTPKQILDPNDTQEMGSMLEYANKFHHDTNQAWETETINDAELLDFSRRTLVFAKR